METLKQIEDAPTARPAVPDYTGGIEKAVDDVLIEPGIIWERIEAHVAHRWGPRGVTWIVEGTGDWVPPLTPVQIETVEFWDGTAWDTYPDAAPTALGGLSFVGSGQFRIGATVGDDSTPPGAVVEAFRRLHEYARGIAEQFKADAAVIQDNGQHGATYAVNWTGRALQPSGAADLLRPYRRA